jgi:hypothetical protein
MLSGAKPAPEGRKRKDMLLASACGCLGPAWSWDAGLLVPDLNPEAGHRSIFGLMSSSISPSGKACGTMQSVYVCPSHRIAVNFTLNVLGWNLIGMTPDVQNHLNLGCPAAPHV